MTISEIVEMISLNQDEFNLFDNQIIEYRDGQLTYSCTYEYKYDKRGNWTSQIISIIFENITGYAITEREITYRN